MDNIVYTGVSPPVGIIPINSDSSTSINTGSDNLSALSVVDLEWTIANSLHSFSDDKKTGTWSAWNEGEHTAIRITGEGDVQFNTRNGSFEMHLAELGRDDTITPVETGKIVVNNRYLEIVRPGFYEWYLNRDESFEQGITITKRPPGTGNLQIYFMLTGNLGASREGSDLVFSDQHGPVFRYAGIRAWDSSGRDIPVWMSISGDRLSWEIDDNNAVYPVTIDPEVTEVKAISASDKAGNDQFGTSTAVSGNVAIVGAKNANSGGTQQGQAYVYYRNQGNPDNWGQVAILSASDKADGDLFGSSVAVSGDTAMVGAPHSYLWSGQVYVFYRNQGGPDNWGQVRNLSIPAISGNQFGYSVAVSGDTAIVGSVGVNSGGVGRGEAYIFYRNQGNPDNWGQVAILSASDKADNDHFGNSVAISGDTVVVGAYNANSGGPDRGQAYIFSRNQGGTDNWGQVAILYASDKVDYDYFGCSVAVSGDTALVGARFANSGGTDMGQAYIFSRNQGGTDNWGQFKIITAPGKADGDLFGSSVAVSGETVVVGAPGVDSGGYDRGQVYIFQKNKGGVDNWGWVAILSASNKANYDYLGTSTAISGDVTIFGAPCADSVGTNWGQAYVFRFIPNYKIGVFRNGFWIIDYNGNYQWDGTTGINPDLVAGFGMTGDKPVIGDWNPFYYTGDKIGVFRNGLWLIDYNGNFQWGGVDKTANIGQAGDIPVVGDWNINGYDKIGVFRNGFWILDKNGNYQWDGTGTDQDLVAGFGQAGDIPVVAGWAGSSQDKIGVFRNGFWILDKNGNFLWDGETDDTVAGFGMAGDVPVVRDWNGDGLAEIGVFRASSGEWMIDYNGNYLWDGTGTGQDVVMSLGQSGDVPVAGDWGMTTSDKLGIFRNGFWIGDLNGNFAWDGTPADMVIGFGQSGDIPVTAWFIH
jgi:hypothetical protein